MAGFGSPGDSGELLTPCWSIRAGPDLCSELRRQLIRRFSAACVLAEELEGRLARGEEIDVERHALLCSSLVRLASASALTGARGTSHRLCATILSMSRPRNEATGHAS